jgi:glyoxylase-like metal-dependent hydrolase (beta-lactamase superfamily II)
MVNHPASAHTDTDSYVYFANGNVVACGDTVSLGERYPTIDYANGGSINGIITTVATYIKMGDDTTKYVPGHGPLASKADMQRYHDMLVRVRDAVQNEIKAGKTEEQAIAAKPLAQIGAQLKTTQMIGRQYGQDGLPLAEGRQGQSRVTQILQHEERAGMGDRSGPFFGQSCSRPF